MSACLWLVWPGSAMELAQQPRTWHLGRLLCFHNFVGCIGCLASIKHLDPWPWGWGVWRTCVVTEQGVGPAAELPMGRGEKSFPAHLHCTE